MLLSLTHFKIMTLGNGNAENKNLRLPLEKILDGYIAAGWGIVEGGSDPTKHLPANFKAKVVDNAHYEKRDGTLSDKAFFALVFNDGNRDTLEISMFQWDILRSNIATYNENGTFNEFYSPNDDFHKFARENAKPTMTIKEWFDKIATFFAEPEKIQLVKLTFRGKTADTEKVKGHLYNGCLIGFNKIG